MTLDNLGPDRLILGNPEECGGVPALGEAVGAGYFLLRLPVSATPTREAHPTSKMLMEAIRLFGGLYTGLRIRR